jgi:hypothetical protein
MALKFTEIAVIIPKGQNFLSPGLPKCTKSGVFGINKYVYHLATLDFSLVFIGSAETLYSFHFLWREFNRE